MHDQDKIVPIRSFRVGDRVRLNRQFKLVSVDMSSGKAVIEVALADYEGELDDSVALGAGHSGQRKFRLVIPSGAPFLSIGPPPYDKYFTFPVGDRRGCKTKSGARWFLEWKDEHTNCVFVVNKGVNAELRISRKYLISGKFLLALENKDKMNIELQCNKMTPKLAEDIIKDKLSGVYDGGKLSGKIVEILKISRYDNNIDGKFIDLTVMNKFVQQKINSGRHDYQVTVQFNLSFVEGTFPINLLEHDT